MAYMELLQGRAAVLPDENFKNLPKIYKKSGLKANNSHLPKMTYILVIFQRF